VSDKAARANKHVHVLRGLREKNCCLTRRVTAADDDNVFAFADLRLDESRAVINPRAFELCEVLEREAAISRARRNDHRFRGNARAVIDLD
jgi:hypothetical protein